jgi:tetratricopeptide (TPR) repeat protein
MLPMTPANLKRAKADIKQCSIDHEPIRWAEAHMFLSHQYLVELSESSGPTRAADKGIEHIEEALKVLTEQECAPIFARAQYGLARLYRQRVSGNRTENLDKALACAKTGLRVCKRHPSCPLSTVADLYALIGSIYQNGDFGSSDSRAANDDLAIRHFLAALQRSSMYDDDSVEWANRQVKVGMIYNDRKNGDRHSNLKIAIKHWLEALKVLTKSKHRDEWAHAHNCLAMAYWQLISTADRAASLAKMPEEQFAEEQSALMEKCIASSTNALQVYSTTNDALTW